MKLALNMKTALQQTLTPQQIQYLKLLQLTTTQLEQHIREEIESNPLLEEVGSDTVDHSQDLPANNEDSFPSEDFGNDYNSAGYNDPNADTQFIGDSPDPFEFYKLVWQDDSDSPDTRSGGTADDDDGEPFQIKDTISLYDDLRRQISFLPLTKEENIIAEFVLGSTNESGYLTKSSSDTKADDSYRYNDDFSKYDTVEEEITARANDEIDEINGNALREYNKKNNNREKINPAREFKISDDIKNILNSNISGNNSSAPAQEENENSTTAPGPDLLKHVEIKDTEKVIRLVQHLDPPGIASRDIRECLLAQLETLPKLNAAQKLAVQILRDAYEPFSKKHFDDIAAKLEVTQEYLKEGIDEIKKLNPKPAGSDFTHELNAVTPDFLVTTDAATGELVITVNDSRLPALKVNDAYNKIRQDAKFQKTKTINANETAKQTNFNRETINWIREKYDDAKFLIQAVRQRKNTMLKVMTAIAYRQKDFFLTGHGIKPLIYKIISEDTGMDISTVCRIVNGKYCQTAFGTFELRYFFSEALINDEGEEVSTRTIKEILKATVDAEDKSKPFSDEKLMQILKEKGYNVARRTVAKYREILNIPVARMRKEL